MKRARKELTSLRKRIEQLECPHKHTTVKRNWDTSGDRHCVRYQRTCDRCDKVLENFGHEPTEEYLKALLQQEKKRYNGEIKKITLALARKKANKQ